MPDDRRERPDDARRRRHREFLQPSDA